MSEVDDSELASEQAEEAAEQPSFDEFIEETTGKLVAATRAANFVSTSDYGLQTASSKEYNAGLKKVSSKLLNVANRLLAYAASGHPSGSAKRQKKIRFEDADQAADRFGPVVDVIDDLLERADTAIDVALGRRPPIGSLPSIPEPSSTSAASPRDIHQDSRSRGKAARLDPKLYNAAHLMRPQLKFEDGVDNSNDNPTRIKITEKPNAVVPLDLNGGGPSFHAYQHEIRNISYPGHLFDPVDNPSFVADMNESAFSWVATVPALETMCAKLEKADEIAVDTENHSYRSFQGFICLIQISTREEDFVIDAIALRAHLHVLNKVFTNPKIIKILHGADMDVQWLQRDFGVYLVGLFDTYHASHVLEMPQHSYAYLLKFYCDIDADKKYQLADWRIRPVPAEMLAYARSDTHYLHYIYDRMKTELIRLSTPEGSNNLLLATMDRSATTALKIYTKEPYDFTTGDGPNGWRKALEKHRGSLVPRQVAVFKRVHYWRDKVAREEDESPAYVLPAKMLGALAETTPTDDRGLAKVCHPMPPLVRTRMNELLGEIKTGLEEAAEASKLADETASRPGTPVAKPGRPGAQFGTPRSSVGTPVPTEDETMEEAAEVPATKPPASPTPPAKRKAEDVEPPVTAAAPQEKPKRKVPKITLVGTVLAPTLARKSTFFDGLEDRQKKAAVMPDVFASLALNSPTASTEMEKDEMVEDGEVEKQEEQPVPAVEPEPEQQQKPSPAPSKPKFDIDTIKLDTMLSPSKSKKRKNPAKELEPFDYSTAKSTALDSVLGVKQPKERKRAEPKFNMDDMEFEVTDDGKTKADLSKIGKALGDGQAQKKKVASEPRAHLMPKSGAKSQTFTGSGKK